MWEQWCELFGNYQAVNSVSEEAQFATNTWDNQVLAKSAAAAWSRAEWNSNVLMIERGEPPSLSSPSRNSWSVWLRWTQPVGWIVKPIWFSNKLQPCWSDFLYFNEGNWWLGLEWVEWRLWSVKKMFCKMFWPEMFCRSEAELKMVTTGYLTVWSIKRSFVKQTVRTGLLDWRT